MPWWITIPCLAQSTQSYSIDAALPVLAEPLLHDFDKLDNVQLYAAANALPDPV